MNCGGRSQPPERGVDFVLWQLDAIDNLRVQRAGWRYDRNRS